MPSLDPTYERWLAIAGWSAIVILWHSTIVALALATWRMWRPRAPAPAQYRGSLVALGACVVLAAATPIGLLAARVDPVAERPTHVRSTTGAMPRETPVARPVTVVDGVSMRWATPALGGLWLVGSAVALVRLAGGWALARWIRRRASALPAGVLEATLDEVSAAWRLPSATVLASAHVEAPVVVGHLAPAVLLPRSAEYLDGEAMRSLIAHELAHVARRDYAVNLAQSIGESLLCFSPAVHWIAGRIREDREYCCDDLVVACCGSRPYVQALTTLAGLGAAAHARPVLSAAGPRLVVRIRRLLQEETMTPFAKTRLGVLIVALALLITVGHGVMAASSDAVAALPQDRPGAPVFVPVTFVPEEAASGISLRSVVPTPTGVCGIVEIENQSDVELVGVRLGAALSAGDRQLHYVELSEDAHIRVLPGARARVEIDLLAPREARIQDPKGRLQATCMVTATRFANGHSWMLPSVAARSMTLRTAFPQSSVPRALVDAPATGARVDICLDDVASQYSPGAIVPVRYEPGRFAKCDGGRWIDTLLPAGGR